jgi:hypothetical protein
LERRAEDYGVVRPAGVGIDDENFRRLAIKTNSNKVVHEALRELLEVYFGQDSLRAYVESEVDEKYSLVGTTLTWTLDEKEIFTHTFVNSEFSSPTQGKAVEVAFALTRTMRELGSKGFAVAKKNAESGKSRVRIYSGSLGLGSFVRITGGTAQNVLEFPTLIDVYSGALSNYSWVYTAPDSDTTRISLTLTNPVVDLTQVEIGDYVVIGTDAGIGMSGSFQIKNVLVAYNTATNITQYFDIENVAFTGTAIQTSNSGYTFYRPTKATTSTVNGRTVVVAQTRPNQVDVTIPATTAIVSRGVNQAIYARDPSPVSVSRFVRNSSGEVTLTTSAPHGLSVGSTLTVAGAIPAPSLPYVTPGNGASHPSIYQYAASPTSIVAESQTPPSALGEDSATCTLSNGQILFAGGFIRSAASITNSTGFQASGAIAASKDANRYVAGSQATITDGTEADGATRHSHTWAATSDMNFQRFHFGMSPFGTGAIATGGMLSSPFSVLSSVEQYQLDSVWLNLSPMATPRTGHSQVTLDSGSIFVVGGATSEGTATKSTEIYNGTSWSAGPSMSIPRADFQLVRLSSGNLMAIGGRTMGAGHLKDAKTLALWRLDEASGTTAADETTNYPLTYSSPTPPTSTLNGKIDRCLDFSASGSRLSGNGSSAAKLALLGEWTVELWHKQSAGSTDPRQFITYGGATGASADNMLLGFGMSDAGRLFWRWENGSGSAVTQGSTFTWPSTPIVSSQQSDPIIEHPIWRENFFNHLALRKSFHSPKSVVSASRTSNVTTLTFSSTHSFAVSDVIYFASNDSANAAETLDGYVPFGTGFFTITAVGSNTISFSDTGANKDFRRLSGSVAKNFDVTLYVNGVQIQQWLDVANASGGPTSGTAWYIAHNPEIANSGCEGFLDDIRVSFKARSEEEIRSNFLRGWGHQRALGEANQAVGAVTSSCEIYDGSTWTLTGNMSIGRAYHQAVVLPGDYILVHGGLGYDDTTVPPISNHETIGLWPNNSLREAEIYDPTVNRWFPVRAAGVRRHGHTLIHLDGKVLAFGGSSYNQTPTDVDDASNSEIFDTEKRSWRVLPGKYRTAAGSAVFAKVANDEAVLYGGMDQTGATNSKALTWIDGSQIVSGPALNGSHRVVSTPNSTTIRFNTTSTPSAVGYSSSTGASFQGDDGTWIQTRVGGTWLISTGVRTSGTTTLTLTFPVGYTSHSFEVGDKIYVNSRTSSFGAGLKTVTAVTSNSVSYAEALGDQSSISVDGSVSSDWSTAATTLAVAASTGAINDPGPYLFDPEVGLAVTAISSTLSSPLYANQQYAEVEIEDGSGQGLAFPDESGYLVFSFGNESQAGPVRYLNRYKSGSTVKLTLDYSYRFPVDQPVGVTVTYLAQREPFAPIESNGSSYVTSSSAGRVAGLAAAEAVAAAGVELNFKVIYPSDRGLGGEGNPTYGAQKLSDVVGVFAGDEINEELQKNREQK